jgi:hypothetical protein
VAILGISHSVTVVIKGVDLHRLPLTFLKRKKLPFVSVKIPNTPPSVMAPISRCKPASTPVVARSARYHAAQNAVLLKEMKSFVPILLPHGL